MKISSSQTSSISLWFIFCTIYVSLREWCLFFLVSRILLLKKAKRDAKMDIKKVLPSLKTEHVLLEKSKYKCHVNTFTFLRNKICEQNAINFAMKRNLDQRSRILLMMAEENIVSFRSSPFREMKVKILLIDDHKVQRLCKNHFWRQFLYFLHAKCITSGEVNIKWIRSQTSFTIFMST